jgi:hypothetical protein
VVPILYGRQAIRLECRAVRRDSSNWVCDVCIANDFRYFRLRLRVHNRVDHKQIVWVLYGQASRAISIG